jgi:hypothetical protein
MREHGLTNRKDALGSAIPGQIVPSSSQHIGRSRVQIRENLLERGADVLLHREHTRWEGLSGKQKQMPSFIRCESEHTRKTLQHLRRRMDIAPLFQPDISGDTDMGKLCDLFPAQSSSPPVTACWQRYISWRQAEAPLA